MSELSVLITAENAELLLKANEAIEKLKELGEEAEKAGEHHHSAFKKMAEGIETYGKMAAGAALALAALWKINANGIMENEHLAKALGLSYEALEQLNYAADVAGVKHEAVTAAMRRMSVQLGEAASKGGPAADALKHMGLNAQELADKKPAEQFQEIAESISKIQNPTERATVAATLFGKQWTEIMPLIQSNLEKSKEELESFHLGLSDLDLTQIKEANEVLNKIAPLIEMIIRKFTADLAPTMKVVAQDFLDLGRGADTWGDKVDRASSFITTAIGVVYDIVEVVQGSFDGAGAAALQFGAAGMQVGTWIWEGLNAVAKVLETVINGYIEAYNIYARWKGLAEQPLLGNMDEDIAKMNKMVDNLSGAASDLADKASDKLTDGFAGKAGDRLKARIQAAKDEALKDTKPEEDGGKFNGIVDSQKEAAELAKREKMHDQFLQKMLELEKTAGEDEVNYIIDKYQKELKEFQKYAKEHGITHKELLDGEAALAKAQDKELMDAQQKRTKEMAAAQVELQKIALQADSTNVKAKLALLDAEHKDQDAKLKELNAKHLITDDQLKKAQLDADRAFVKSKADIYAQGNQQLLNLNNLFEQSQLQGYLGTAAALLDAMGSHSRKAFELAKVAKLAEAAVTLPATVMNAYNAGMQAGGPLGPEVGAAYAAIALATQLTQMRAIQSASFGGGSAGGSSSAPAASVAPTRVVNVQLNGSDNSSFSKQQVRGLIGRINTEIAQGATLNVKG